MKLTDDLRKYIKTIEGHIAYTAGKQHQIEVLQEVNRTLTIDLEEAHKLWGETTIELAAVEEENTALRESLKLIETTHGVDPNTNMCTLAERFRVVLSDMVRMYSALELEKELLGAKVKSGEQEIIILETEVTDEKAKNIENTHPG